MQNPLENFKNPWDADGEFAQSFLNVDKVLNVDKLFNQDTSLKSNITPKDVNMEAKKPKIYIFSETVSTYNLQLIAKEVKNIYYKQKQIYGEHLALEVEVITFQEHKNKGYDRNETWVEVITISSSLEETGDVTSMKLHGQPMNDIVTFYCYVLYNQLNGVFNPYTLAYNVAHEALHAFIFKAIFYVKGKDSYEEYEKNKSPEYGDDNGHYNGYDVIKFKGNGEVKEFTRVQVVNLNMNGEILSTKRPTSSTKTLQPAEKIIAEHWSLLRSLFYAWLPANGYKQINSKRISYKKLERGNDILD
jgi:hypothetical protein